jgi:hypothetical protein
MLARPRKRLLVPPLLSWRRSYLQGLFSLAHDPEPRVRQAVCTGLVQALAAVPERLAGSMPQLVDYMLQSTQDDNEGVALESCEFWSAFCESQLEPEVLRPFLPRLLPVLLRNMVRARLLPLLLPAPAAPAAVNARRAGRGYGEGVGRLIFCQGVACLSACLPATLAASVPATVPRWSPCPEVARSRVELLPPLRLRLCLCLRLGLGRGRRGGVGRRDARGAGAGGRQRRARPR